MRCWLLATVVACVRKDSAAFPLVGTPPDPTAPPVLDDDEDDDGWPVGEDCDDGDPDLHPAADEHCDAVDEDCDGQVDEDAVDAPEWREDTDGDGFGARSL